MNTRELKLLWIVLAVVSVVAVGCTGLALYGSSFKPDRVIVRVPVPAPTTTTTTTAPTLPPLPPPLPPTSSGPMPDVVPDGPDVSCRKIFKCRVNW